MRGSLEHGHWITVAERLRAPRGRPQMSQEAIQRPDKGWRVRWAGRQSVPWSCLHRQGESSPSSVLRPGWGLGLLADAQTELLNSALFRGPSLEQAPALNCGAAVIKKKKKKAGRFRASLERGALSSEESQVAPSQDRGSGRPALPTHPSRQVSWGPRLPCPRSPILRGDEALI